MTAPQGPWPGPSDPHAQPQYGQPQYGQPQYGQPQYGQPQYGHPQGQYGQYDQPQWGGPPPPAKPGRRGKLIALSAAVVVLAGGGVAAYVATSDSDSDRGAASPQDAVRTLVADLDDDDLIGVLESLPPNEQDAVTKPFLETIDQLKRTKALRPDADLKHVSGLDITATGITYGDRTVAVSDSVQVVQITGGTLGFDGDATKLPLTSEFLQALGGIDSNARATDKVDLGQLARREGRPLRIATQKVDGKWYPSLFYTIADNVAQSEQLGTPSTSDRIPDKGESSPDAAVRSMVDALLTGRVERAIELVSPVELGVLHDYGRLVTERLKYDPAGVTIKDIRFRDSTTSGATVVKLQSLQLATGGGESIGISVDGSCVQIQANGDQRRICASDAGSQLQDILGRALSTDEQVAVEHAVSGITDVGVLTTKVDGAWYVNPIRTYSDLDNVLLKRLQGDDLLVLVKLFGGLA